MSALRIKCHTLHSGFALYGRRSEAGNKKRWRGFAFLVVCTVIVNLSVSHSVRADIDSMLEAEGWSEFRFDDKPANQFTVVSGTPSVIRIDTQQSVSIAYLPFPEGSIDLGQTPVLSFSWQKQGQTPDTDLTRKGGDDRIAAVYVAFPYQPENASIKDRLLRPFVEARQGKDAPGRVLTYLWGGGAKRGEWFENPYTGKAGWMQIRQLPSEPEQVWFSHEIDVAADFMNRFGYEAPSPSYIAITADSDDTDAMFSVFIKGLALRKK